MPKIALFLVRVSLGVLFLYAGVSKLMHAGWSAAGYLGNAAHLHGFYAWLASPGLIGCISTVNEWALTLLGLSLILGLGVRLSAWLGALLMLLYYLVLPFPHPNPNSFIVDEHIVYLFVLLYFAVSGAGRTIGLDGWLSRKPGFRWLTG